MHAFISKGVCRISQGGANYKILGNLDIHAMSRAVKLRAIAREVWGHALQENF